MLEAPQDFKKLKETTAPKGAVLLSTVDLNISAYTVVPKSSFCLLTSTPTRPQIFSIIFKQAIKTR